MPIRSLMSRLIAVLLVAGSFGMVVGQANAATWCVTPATGCDHDVADPASALAGAQDNPGPDTVRLGAATYRIDSPGLTYGADGQQDGNSVPSGPLEIDGAGRDATTLAVPGTSGSGPSAVLTATGPNDVTIKHLTASSGHITGASNSVFRMDGVSTVIDDVALTNNGRPKFQPDLVGVLQSGGDLSLTSSTVSLTGDSAVSLSDATGQISSVSGSAGINATGSTLTVDHVDLEPGSIGTTDDPDHDGSVTIDDSRFDSLSAQAASSSVLVVGRHLMLNTVDIEGSSPSITATAQVDSSVITGAGTRIDVGLATLSIDYSAFDPSTVTTGSGGTLTSGAHNIDTSLDSPQFLGPTNFHLGGGSPLIDAGEPVLSPSEPTTDLDGHPRAIAGSSQAGCTAVPDIGPYEFQRHSPIAAAKLLPGGRTTADAIGFDASGSCDATPGDPLTYTWTFDDGTTASGVTASHQFTVVGAHFATVTARDTAGATSTSLPVSVTVTLPPSPPRVLQPTLPPGLDPITPPPSTFAGARPVGSPKTVDRTGHLSWTFSCPATTVGACRETITVTTPATALARSAEAKAKAKPVKITSATATLNPGRTTPVRFHLTGAALKALTKHHHLQTAVTILSHDGDGHSVTTHATPRLALAKTHR